MNFFTKFILVSVLTISAASAWEPAKPIKVIVGNAPGSGNELAIRAIGSIIEKTNPNVTFLVEHHPGMDGIVGMNYFAKQKADGYTIMVATAETSFITAPTISGSHINPGADPDNYVPVAMLGRSSSGFVVPMNSPIKTLPELLENLRNTKQKINIGTGGSANLLIYKYLINNLNIDKERVQLIPYNSPMAATIAAGAGDIDLAIVTVSSVKSLIGTKVRLLAISGGNKIDSLDRVPLIKDFIPGLVWDSSWVVFLPPNAPQEVRNWYNKQFKTALESAAAKKYFNDNWAVIDERTITSAGLTADIVLLKKKWLPIAKTVLVDNK